MEHLSLFFPDIWFMLIYFNAQGTFQFSACVYAETYVSCTWVWGHSMDVSVWHANFGRRRFI